MPSLSPYRAELDYSYAPGIYPSMECLIHRPRLVRRLLIHSGSAGREGMDRLTELAARHGIRTEEADRALSRVSGKDNCFAAAVFSKFSDTPDSAKPHVVLHCPSDAGNVGTILRTALGFGIEDVILIRPCVDVFDPKTVRASMGSLFSLRIQVLDGFEEYLAQIDAGRVLYPFMLTASVTLAEAVTENADRNFTLVFGNEGSGLPEEFLRIGRPVRIESNNRVDSLNLSIAAAIGIYGFTVSGFEGRRNG